MNLDLRCSSSPRVSVIIPATASLEMLLATLGSIARHAPSDIAMETIVVLNASLAEHAGYLAGTVSGVVVLSSPVNLGLAGAANRGRTVARGELLIVLHDDAEIEPGWLEALVEAADGYPQAGVVGGKVLFPDGSLQNAGMVLWSDATSSPPWTGETPPPTAFDDVRAVDYCGTSSLLVRRDVWDAIGGLDERFYPVYYVDVDLAMSVRKMGLIVLYQPASQIRHHRGASTGVRWRTFVAAANRRLLLEKWGPALEQHEPTDSSDLPAAIRRAASRAAAFAVTATANYSPSCELPASLKASVPTPPDSVYLHKERSLLDAYSGHLSERFDDVENQLKAALTDSAAARAELRALRATSRYQPGTRLSFGTMSK